MKLFAKYNRINLMAMLLILAFSGVGNYFVVKYVVIHELDETILTYQEKIQDYVKKNDALPAIGVLDDVVIIYESAKAASPGNHFSLTDRYYPQERKKHSFRQLEYVQKTGPQFYKITIAQPLEGIRLFIKTLSYSTIATLLIVMGISLLLNYLVLRRLWEPFYGTLQAIRKFKVGKKSLPIFEKTGVDEFDFMNLHLSETIESAENDYQILKEFTENASHELQTPLAIIRSKLDLIIQEEGLSVKQSDALSAIYSGVKRLTRLNQSLLLLAKIENNQFEIRTEINLKTKFEEKLDQFREFWQENNISVTNHLEPASITASNELMDILLNNLLGNAGRHNIANGTISVTLAQGELLISNTGKMVALDGTRLYKRFYKGQQESQHHGLGLSIVKQICDISGIEINYQFTAGNHAFRLKWH